MGKAFARVLLIRLQKLASRVYPETQCEFRAGRSIIDMIFSGRQLQEKCREQGMPLYVAFIDLTNALDLVSRKGLFRLLEKIGCTPKLRSMVVSFHENMKGTVVYDCSTSEPFPACSGVNIVRDLLLPLSVICLRLFLRRYLPAHQIWWEAVQPGTSA